MPAYPSCFAFCANAVYRWWTVVSLARAACSAAIVAG